MDALYLLDSYQKSCTAEIVAIDGLFVALSRTIFYPTSGGQPCDLGILESHHSYAVVSVFQKDGLIWHEVADIGLCVGDEVVATLDWDRRYRLMRMHTASHVLAALLHTRTGALITGNQLGLDSSRLDFNIIDYDPSLLQEIVAEANRRLTLGASVSLRTVSRAEAEAMSCVAKLAKGLHPSVSSIRLVALEGIDEQACGGTHVRDLSEVGTISFLKSENKGKGNRRVYFTLDHGNG